MSNGYLTGCALAICLLICFIYFSKNRVKNRETKLFKYLLFSNLAECCCTNLIVLVALTINSNLLFVLLNRLDVIAIILWISFMFLYISNLFREETYDKTKKFVMIIDVIFLIFVLFLNVEIIASNGVLDSKGPLPTFALLASGFYVILMIFRVFTNRKKNISNQKLLPLYVLIVFIIAMAFLRVVLPSVNFISILISFINLIMIFTIENPDIKMITQLEIAKESAEKANRAKSDFLSSMSHEIRTPLNAIVGLSQDIVNYDIPKEALEDASDIINASNTLLEIVGNILDINKIESDKMEIIEKPYNFRSEIESLIRVTQTRIGEKPIEFSYNIAEDIPDELIGDKVHIKAIVNNLVTNAIKYTDKGNINVSIKCINREDICTLYISVQDTGRGIKADDINKLFNKFERLDIEKNSTTEGTGLGLAITKRLTEMMGGKINVQSTYGIGSLFVVSVPQKISKREDLTNTQIIRTQNIISNLRSNYKGKKILIVDDNKLNIKVARRALNDFEFSIDEAYNGEECINLIKSGNSYDLILMDIMMPVMSGTTALNELKKIEGFNTPVIALTADALSGSEEKYKSEGFVCYIAKPFSKEQIQEKLDYVFMRDSM